MHPLPPYARNTPLTGARQWAIAACLALAVGAGCARSQQPSNSWIAQPPVAATGTAARPVVQPVMHAPPPVLPASHDQEIPAPQPPHHGPFPPGPSPPGPAPATAEEVRPVPLPPMESLEELEAFALANSPVLRRMQEEAAAAWAKTGYVDKLPDPTLKAMFFGDSMMMVPDRQLAEIEVMQMIPWLGRLKAEARRAYFEALAAETMYAAQRVELIGDLRAAWLRLYVLGKQIEIAEADKRQVQSLIDTANARIRTGDAQPGDVLMATLELSNLEEQLLDYRQQVAATIAELNRLAGRDPRVPLALPEQIDAELPDWSHDLLRDVAFQYQPEVIAARLESEASRWGIEVARLQRRPDVSLGAGWMPMAADPADTMPGAGDDAWALGFQVNVPLWHGKYNAMEAEAARRHFANRAQAEAVALRFDALLRELWEQALAAHNTVRLYETTILPQARQTLDADLQSLANNTVTFDRVIRNYRTLLNLELGYHRARGQLATTLARIRQAVGVDLTPAALPLPPDR